MPNGVLDGRVAPTGHRWRAWGAGGRDGPMVVLNRAIGPPGGHVPGASYGPDDPSPSASAGYSSIDLGGKASQIFAQWRWDPSRSSSTALGFGAFDFGTVGGGSLDGLQGSNAHLAVTPAFLQFAVFSQADLSDFTVLTPRGGSSGTVYFSRPQVRDGRYLYRGYITVSGDTARLDLDGLGAPLVYQDPRIASVPATHPFWQYYSTPGGTNLPRFVRVSADRAA